MADPTIHKNLTKVNLNGYSGKACDRVKYIVIHYTGNNGDTAYGNTNYFKSVNRNASAHYFVDENEIWQCVDDRDIAWHCGTSGTYYHKYCRNNNSIGVELCSRKDKNGRFYFLDKTVDNAVKLVKSLMEKYGVTKENVIRHYDVTHKNCPAPFVENAQAWSDFRSRIAEKEDKEMVDTTSIKINGTECSINRILKDGKNYICLSDLKDKGFNVGYDANTKTPSLDVDIKDIAILIDGKETSVRGINVNGTNLVAMRDIIDKLGGLAIDYKEKPVITRFK